MNLFEDPALDTPEEKKERKEREEKRIAEEKARQKAEKEALKALANSISDSAYWMSYCGLQKAIRLGEPEAAKKLAMVVWLKNSWLLYRRLNVVMFEDVGVIDQSAMEDFSKFYTRQKSYKNFSDIAGLVEKMAKAIKNRDANQLLCMNYRKNPPKDVFEVSVGLKYFKDPWDMYDEEKFDQKLVGICAKADSMVQEKQNRFIPFLEWHKRTAVKEIVVQNTAQSPSHALYRDIMPFTVLDMHGWHGKNTMELFFKKLEEKRGDFLEKHGLKGNPKALDIIKFFVFMFEGQQCDREVFLTKADDLMWRMYYAERKLKCSFDELKADFLPLLDNLKTLREWSFSKKFGKIINEIDELVKTHYENTIRSDSHE